MKPGGISAFSRDFAAALRSVMTQYDVRQNALAGLTDRSPGYVSEHLSGRRAVDTDLLDAVAQLARMDTSALVSEVTRRMAAAGDPSARRFTAGHDAVEVEETATRMAQEARKSVRAAAPAAKVADAEDEARSLTIRPQRRRSGSA